MITSANPASLSGRWLNTNSETRGISECVIAYDGQDVTVTITAVGNNGRESWNVPRAIVLANLEEEAGQRTVALLATFECANAIVDTHIRVNKGVLVIVLYVTFDDNSGRSNYLNREFFYRAE